ncbi:hypothetical protein TNCT_375221 [Trichonephila clavata]|uniref:Uncharacterized protein n=1 Tax=Trichonephila clavata TaxID=2740835 RepID=A0A8X6H9U3_TRICU|nr:hypothetical protein TNCT_375221 [Trichonephila clavata]
MTLSDSSAYHKLMNQFPSLTKASFLGINFRKQDVTHCILMKGPPEFDEARHLYPENLVAVKEIQSLFDKGIICPSNSLLSTWC